MKKRKVHTDSPYAMREHNCPRCNDECHCASWLDTSKCTHWCGEETEVRCEGAKCKICKEFNLKLGIKSN